MSARRGWPLLATLLFLVALRLKVIFDSAASYSWDEVLGDPLLALSLWQDIVRSISGESLVLIGAWFLLGTGQAGRWAARALVSTMLVINVVQVAVFGYWAAYLNGYQLLGLTLAELSTTLTTHLGLGNFLLLSLALVFGWFFGGGAPLEVSRLRLRERLLGASLVVLLGVAVFQLERWPLAYRTTAHSPLLALARVRPPELSWLPDGKAAVEDWSGGSTLAPTWTRLETADRPFNVVVFVLESIRARSFWPSPDAPPMPSLDRVRGATAVFSRAYGHSPQSIRGLEALVFGVFPPPAWELALRRSNALALESLPERLAANGVRTAVLLNGDDRFDEQGPLLENRGLSLFAAADGITGPHPPKSDLNLVPTLERFVDEDPESPFVAVLMTRETHFPYLPVQPAPDAPPPTTYEAYRYTIAQTDRLLEETMALLERKGLTERTVLVLTADHGESFHEHADGGSGHGQRVYDESLHIPLVFINPTLFRGERDDRIVQLKDVAATVAWLAGADDPVLNVGTSVFFERPSHAAYLVNFTDGLAGAVVQGRFKYHYLRTPGEPVEERLYDVEADPGETNDLSARDPQRTAAMRLRYFGWFNHWVARWAEMTEGDQSDRQRVSAALVGE